MRDVNAYGNEFTKILTTEFSEPEISLYSFAKKAKEYSAQEITELFPSKDKLWLAKELSKWKSKILDNCTSFNPTLQNLFIFCSITGASPNDVLEPGKELVRSNRVHYLSYEAIVDLVRMLRDRGTLNNNCTVPILHAPMKMTTAFLSIYKRCVNRSDDIYMSFLISYSQECTSSANPSDSLGGLSSDQVIFDKNRKKEIKITNNKNVFDELECAYAKMKDDFDTALHDMSYIVDDFYEEVSEWATSLSPDSNYLVRQFAVPIDNCEANRKYSVDSLVSESSSSMQQVKDER